MIEEIPTNSEINSEIHEINAEPVDAGPVDAEEPAPAPKKRGRPFGAKGKAKPKAAPTLDKTAEARPKKKPRVVASVASVEVSPESESEEEVVPMLISREKKKTRRPAPEPESRIPTTQDVAWEVMQLLSNRHVDQAAQRRAKYASWFQ